MKVYELLANPESWTKGHNARDTFNNPADPNSTDACKWCLLGAFIHCYPSISERSNAMSYFSDAIRGESIW